MACAALVVSGVAALSFPLGMSEIHRGCGDSYSNVPRSPPGPDQQLLSDQCGFFGTPCGAGRHFNFAPQREAPPS